MKSVVRLWMLCCLLSLCVEIKCRIVETYRGWNYVMKLQTDSVLTVRSSPGYKFYADTEMIK